MLISNVVHFVILVKPVIRHGLTIVMDGHCCGLSAVHGLIHVGISLRLQPSDSVTILGLVPWSHLIIVRVLQLQPSFLDVPDHLVVLLIVQLVERGIAELLHLLVKVSVVEELILPVRSYQGFVQEVESVGKLLVAQYCVVVENIGDGVFYSLVVLLDVHQVLFEKIEYYQVLWVVPPHLAEISLGLNYFNHQVEGPETLVYLIHKLALDGD